MLKSLVFASIFFGSAAFAGGQRNLSCSDGAVNPGVKAWKVEVDFKSKLAHFSTDKIDVVVPFTGTIHSKRMGGPTIHQFEGTNGTGSSAEGIHIDVSVNGEFYTAYVSKGTRVLENYWASDCVEDDSVSLSIRD